MNTLMQTEIHCSTCQKTFAVSEILKEKVQRCPFCNSLFNRKEETDECPHVVRTKNGNGSEPVEAYNFNWFMELFCKDFKINPETLCYAIGENGNIHVYTHEDEQMPLIKFDINGGYVYSDQEIELQEH